jgi:outer membrane protein assembly factor BamB
MSKRFVNLSVWMALITLLLSACHPKPAAVALATDLPSMENPPPTEITTSVISSAADNFKERWGFRTEGAIWGTPTVYDGTVYIGSDDGRLYAIDAQNGNLKWAFSTQGIVRSRPSIADGLVYISSDDGKIYAINTQSGKQAWRKEIGNFLPREKREKLGTNTAPTGWDDLQSSPVAVDDQVFVGSLDGKLYALDARTGDIKWTFKTGEKVRATPTVKEGIVYIGSWDGTVSALDARTGVPFWTTPIGGQVQTTALVVDGVIFTASRKASVVALNAHTGEMIWECDYGKNMWVESSPVMQEGIVYIGSAANRWIFGLDSLKGNTITAFISPETYFMSTPAIVDDMLFIGGVTFKNQGVGGLFTFNLVDGKFSDSSKPFWYLLIEESLEEEGNWSGVMSSPVVDGRVGYFGGLDGKLYAFGKK